MNIFPDGLPDFETQRYNPPHFSDDEDIIPDESPLYQNQMMDPNVPNLCNSESTDSEEPDFFKQHVAFG